MRPRHPKPGAPLRSATRRRVPQAAPEPRRTTLSVCSFHAYTSSQPGSRLACEPHHRHIQAAAASICRRSLITAVASAVAAYVTSQLWAPGTLAAAAFTPVLVALLKEMLAKPAEVVTRAVPVRGVVRSASSAGRAASARAAPRDARGDRGAHRAARRGAGRVAPGPPAAHWQAAVVTGLLGFLVAAVIITVPELVAGSSASGGGRDTTFFGGKKASSSAPTDTTTDDDDRDDAAARPRRCRRPRRSRCRRRPTTVDGAAAAPVDAGARDGDDAGAEIRRGGEPAPCATRSPRRRRRQLLSGAASWRPPVRPPRACAAGACER